MGRESTLTIYRKYTSDKFKLDDVLLQQIKNTYTSQEGTEIKSFPNIIDTHKLAERISHNGELNALRDRYYTRDGYPVDEIITEHWCSSFTVLWDKYQLNGYSYSNSSCEIPFIDAKEIRQALNYILSKKWNKDIEEILDNKWVAPFTENYCAYQNKMMPNNKRFYIEKIGKDEWSISSSEYEYLNEVQEDNTEKEYNMHTLKSILDTYITLKNDFMNHINNVDYILVYEVSA